MKKLLLTTTLSLAAIASSFAQGTVTFENSFSTGNIYFSDLNRSLAPAGGYTVALLYAPGTTPVSQSSLQTLVTFGPAGTQTGFFSDPVPVTTPNTTAGGTPAIFEVEAWTGNFANFAAAVAAGAPVGVTGEFVNGTGNPNAVPVPGVPVDLTGWDGNLVIEIWPEPSTTALAGLGAAALLLFRRRK